MPLTAISEGHRPSPELSAEIRVLRGVEGPLEADENSLHSREPSDRPIRHQVEIQSNGGLFLRIPYAENNVLLEVGEGPWHTLHRSTLLAQWCDWPTSMKCCTRPDVKQGQKQRLLETNRHGYDNPSSKLTPVLQDTQGQ